MSNYIVCHLKRNNPRIDVRICEKKCDVKGECKSYNTFDKIVIQAKSSSIPSESRPAA